MAQVGLMMGAAEVNLRGTDSGRSDFQWKCTGRIDLPPRFPSLSTRRWREDGLLWYVLYFGLSFGLFFLVLQRSLSRLLGGKLSGLGA